MDNPDTETKNKALQNTRVFLVEHINPDVLWDHLLGKDIFKEMMIENIKCKSPRSEQIRSLLSDLRRRVCCDPGTYERFLTCLEESGHQHCAKEVRSNMEKLLMEKGQSPIMMETLDPNPESGPTFGALSTPSSNADVEMRDGNSYSGVQESLQSSGSDMYQAAQQSPYLKFKEKNDVYKMESSPRGSVFIINNLKFQHMKQRKGSEKDEENLQELFEHLDFTVDCEKNLKASEMKNKLQEFAQSDQLRKVDSCIIVILSHGGQCGIFGVDGINKDGGSNFITDSDLKIIFSNEKCEHLLEKPKLFLIQACRGNVKDKGVLSLSSSNSFSSISASYLSQDGGHVTQDVTQDMPTSLREEVWSQAKAATFLPTFSDMVIAHCSSDGRTSYRLPEEGSVFIKEVIKVFRENAHDTHVMDMLTKVNDEVATKFGTTHGNKMMPQPTTLLRKKWFLNPTEARV